jgi:hypothetical protein
MTWLLKLETFFKRPAQNNKFSFITRDDLDQL